MSEMMYSHEQDFSEPLESEFDWVNPALLAHDSERYFDLDEDQWEAYVTSFEETVQTLMGMLSYRRPAGSQTEEDFIDRYIRPLKVEQDAFGNLYKQVGKSRIIWSCHTDTMHNQDGIQELDFNAEIATVSVPFVSLDKVSQPYGKRTNNTKLPVSNCLGGDCTTGVWLMCQMIERGVPGLYIFHREEEIGGNGSRYFVKHNQKKLQEYDAVIALDRMGYTDVITHQMYRSTASYRFAKHLAEMLGGKYQPSSEGVFTDSENYAGVVSECTNISIGYHNQHGPRESQNIFFASQLLEVLCTLPTHKLVPYRDPTSLSWSAEYSAQGQSSWGLVLCLEEGEYNILEDEDGEFRKFERKEDVLNYVEENGYVAMQFEIFSWGEHAVEIPEESKYEEIICTYPEVVNKVLWSYGVTRDILREEVYNETGDVIS